MAVSIPDAQKKPLQEILMMIVFIKYLSKDFVLFSNISSNMSDKPARDEDLYPEIHILSIMKISQFLRYFFSKMQHKILFILSMLEVQYLYTDI